MGLRARQVFVPGAFPEHTDAQREGDQVIA
jgi:hypothetical protein